jgi:peptidyl-Lys metalloendopeptidase
MKFATALASSAFLAAPVFAALTVEYSDAVGTTFKATVSTDEDVTLLAHPNSVLTPGIDTDTFKFTSEDGKSPDFVGVAGKWDLDSLDKVVLKAGESKTFEYDAATSYDFAKSGDSTYTIDGGDLLWVVGDDGEVKTETATVVTSTAKVTGSAATRKREHTPVYGTRVKRSKPYGCSAAQSAALAQATPAAQKYITNTLSYTGSVTGPTPRYTWWFGSYDPGRRAMVMDHFSRMVNDPNDVITTYDCSTCPGTQYANAYAYVYPNKPYYIYLCKAFWNAPVTGTDSKAGTIVHELSHFDYNGATRDYAYGQSAAHSLAGSNPPRAVMNADSHEYYAENTPFRS